MKPVKILLLCSSRLALPALQELAFFKMLAIVVIPAHCDEMIELTQFILTGSDIPVLMVDKTSFIEQLKDTVENYQITVGLIITFSYKIPRSVYSLPPDGFYNVHPGPLPEYRGADPIFQQVKNKEKLAGITVHKLVEDFDAGPIVIKEMIRLETTDTYGILTTKLAQVAARLTMVLLKLVSFDVVVPSKAQDESKAVYYRRQAANEVTIDWQLMNADTIVALINACNPWNKGASTKINNKIIRFLEAHSIHEVMSMEQTVPGTILTLDDKGLTVSTLNHECLRIHIIYVDEGFMNAGRLIELGIVAGNKFEQI